MEERFLRGGNVDAGVKGGGGDEGVMVEVWDWLVCEIN